MIKSINIILKKCLAIKKDEKLLIITDSKLFNIANLILKEAKKITDNIKLIKTQIPKVSGTEPNKKIADEMLKYPVQILITTKSLSHTKAREKASSKGARIATMPGTTKDMIKRAIDIDYEELKRTNNKLANILDKGKEVIIKTKKGTDICFSIKGRKAHGRGSGICNKKGSFSNLPEGEVFISPIEKTANGTFIVDASFAGIGKLKKQLKVNVKNGYAISFQGEKSKKMEKLLDSVNKEARNIAEFGIGTNKKAKITGNILEDEKVKGTCHIALGNNMGFGGRVNVPLHLDGIIKKPTIWINNKKIMDCGKFLV